jgi:hypothetical protein
MVPASPALVNPPRHHGGTGRRYGVRVRRLLVALFLVAAVAAAAAALRSRRAAEGPHGGGTPLSLDTWPEVPKAQKAA